MNSFLESIIFFYVLQHQDLTQAFKAEFFNTKYIQELFKILKPHVLTYGSMPTMTQTLDLITLADKQDILPEDVVKSLWNNIGKVNEYTDDWLHQNATSFAEWQNILNTIRKVLTYVKTIQSDVTFENCSDYVERIKSLFAVESNFNIGVTDGYDFFDLANHKIKTEDTWKTGYNFIDLVLNGGFAKKTLNIFMGPPKIGKSKWLCNLAANSVKAGNDTAYITLEMSYQLVNQRIGSNLFKVSMKDYQKMLDDSDFMNKKVQEFYASQSNSLQGTGQLIVEEFPTSSATVNDIENFLLHKEQELSTETKPFKFKNVFIDYINIMKDKRNPNTENLYIKIKNICEDVRAMAQRNNWAVISATQTNRSAFDSTDMGMSSVSESAGLIATVDSLFGIIQNALMRAGGVYYLKAIAVRNSEHMGDKKKFKENRTYLEIVEDMTEDIIQEDTELPGQWNATKLPAYMQQNQEPAQQAPQAVHLGIPENQLKMGSLFD